MPSTTRRGLLATLGVGAIGAAVAGIGSRRDRSPDCLAQFDPRWTVRGRGPGWWAPPVVDDGTVYAAEGHGITSSSGPEQAFRLVALDGYGDARWALGERQAGWGLPTVADERVYAASGRNRVYAIDRVTGRVHWHYDASAAERRSGSWARPAVTGATVVVSINRPVADRFDGDHAVVGLDREDGSERWIAPVDGRFATALRLVDGALVAVTRSGNAYGFDPDTGERRWSTALGTEVNFDAGGVVRDGRLILPTIDGHRFALDAEGETAWTERLVGSAERPDWARELDASLSSVVDAGEALLVGDIAGRVRALDPTDRTERWRYRTSAAVGAVATDDDRTAILDQRGLLHAVETGNGEMLDRGFLTDFHPGDRCGWPPRQTRVRGLALDGHEVTATGPWVRRFRV